MSIIGRNAAAIFGSSAKIRATSVAGRSSMSAIECPRWRISSTSALKRRPSQPGQRTNASGRNCISTFS